MIFWLFISIIIRSKFNFVQYFGRLQNEWIYHQILTVVLKNNLLLTFTFSFFVVVGVVLCTFCKRTLFTIKCVEQCLLTAGNTTTFEVMGTQNYLKNIHTYTVYIYFAAEVSYLIGGWNSQFSLGCSHLFSVDSIMTYQHLNEYCESFSPGQTHVRWEH